MCSYDDDTPAGDNRAVFGYSWLGGIFYTITSVTFAIFVIQSLTYYNERSLYDETTCTITLVASYELPCCAVGTCSQKCFAIAYILQWSTVDVGEFTYTNFTTLPKFNSLETFADYSPSFVRVNDSWPCLCKRDEPWIVPNRTLDVTLPPHALLQTSVVCLFIAIVSFAIAVRHRQKEPTPPSSMPTPPSPQRLRPNDFPIRMTNHATVFPPGNERVV